MLVSARTLKEYLSDYSLEEEDSEADDGLYDGIGCLVASHWDVRLKPTELLKLFVDHKWPIKLE